MVIAERSALALLIFGLVTMEDYFMLGALIAAGALTNTMVNWKTARENGVKYDFVDFVIGYVIASFAGVMFAIGSQYFSSDPLVHHGVSGAGAFLGLTGMNKMTDVFIDIVTNRAKNAAGDA